MNPDSDQQNIIQPENNIPPEPVLAGMKVIQPVSENIVIDPLPERPVPNVNNTTPPNVFIPPLPVNEEAPSTALKQVSATRRNNAIANWIIIAVGVLILLSVLINVMNQFGNQNSSNGQGFALIGDVIEAIVGLGLILRIDMMRRIIMILLVINTLFGIYATFIAAAVITTSYNADGTTTTSSSVNFWSITTGLAIPVILLICLNLRAVKLAFSR